MKKIVSRFIFSFAFLFVMGLSLSPIEASANELMHEGENKGAYNVREETDECGSGVKHWCHGDGTVCEITIEWDCE